MLNIRPADISFINIAKAIAMFFVVFGHLPIPNASSLFVNSFHMPLFFIISGYLISTDAISFKSFFIKKVKTLLIPYYIFAIISLLFWYFLGRKYGDDALSKDNTANYIIGAFLAIPAREYLGFNVPIWFLPSLFCTEIIFYLLKKYLNTGLIFVVSCVCFGIGVLMKEFVSFRLPFGLDVSLFALLFICVGYGLNRMKIIAKIERINLTLKIFFIIVLGLLTYYVSNMNNLHGIISMVHRVFNNYFLFFVGAFSGSLFLILLSNCMPNHRLFRFYGRNTIIILGFHLMCFSLIKAVQLFIFHIPLEVINGNFLINTLYAIFTFILLSPVIYLINKYMPFIIGRKKGIL